MKQTCKKTDYNNLKKAIIESSVNYYTSAKVYTCT